MLASTRPPPHLLTSFYLHLAVGGALGSAFNALLAPLVFNDFWELPLVVTAVVAAVSTWDPARTRRDPAWGVPLAIVVGAILGAAPLLVEHRSAQTGLYPLFAPVAGVGAVLVLVGPVRRHAGRLLPALGVLLLGSFGATKLGSGEVLNAERSFFGRFSVVSYGDGAWRALRHGHTFHGYEGSGANAGLPTAYYHPSGPIGQVLTTLSGDPRLSQVGVVGMGAGALAAYANPGQTWVFYELDPGILRVALNPDLFTFVGRAHARSTPEAPVDLRFVAGDGRLALEKVPDGRFGLLVLDAFSSDSIPVHLLTDEAVATYASKVRADGILAFHISNISMDLEPILSAIAEARGLVAWYRFDDGQAHPEQGQKSCAWMLLARDDDALAPVRALTDATGAPAWRPARPADARDRWTDDHVDLTRAIRWLR